MLMHSDKSSKSWRSGRQANDETLDICRGRYLQHICQAIIRHLYVNQLQLLPGSPWPPRSTTKLQLQRAFEEKHQAQICQNAIIQLRVYGILSTLR